MRPGFTEAESRGGFLGGKFGGRLNDGAEWIAHHAGILSVSVVNAPPLVAWLQSRGRAHGRSRAHTVFALVYLIHNMRAESV